MGNEKYSFLKQWFTFTFSNKNTTELIYSCTNNHYIHTWFEEHGYTDFENVISLEVYDKFIHSINESSNMIPDNFDEHFPDNYISHYSLWNMDLGNHWRNKKDYKEHAKEQMEIIFNKLWEYNDYMEDGTKGVLKYHIFYHC